MEKWVHIVSNNLKAAGVPPRLQLCAITNYVKGSALSSLIDYQNSNANASIEGFYDLLKRSENAIARRRLVHNKLMTLKQHAEFDVFLNEFKELAGESELRESDLILLFTNGLSHRTSFEVSVREPKELIEAYRIATVYEDGVAMRQGGGGQQKSYLSKETSNSS